MSEYLIIGHPLLRGDADSGRPHPLISDSQHSKNYPLSNYVDTTNFHDISPRSPRSRSITRSFIR